MAVKYQQILNFSKFQISASIHSILVLELWLLGKLGRTRNENKQSEEKTSKFIIFF
jgi:hypothetical protein